MPGWQQFYGANRRDDFELISIAVDHGGVEAARPYVEAAEAEFRTAVDERGVLSQRMDFKVVPNGVLIDEAGRIRYAKYGGFSIDNPEDVAAVERFLAGDDPGPSPAADRKYQLDATTRELVETKLRLGLALNELERSDEAVKAWQEALRLDPENFTIRKQIWATEHPEKFHPVIDFDWQKARLQAEREREIADGVCGPDGCPLPWAGR